MYIGQHIMRKFIFMFGCTIYFHSLDYFNSSFKPGSKSSTENISNAANLGWQTEASRCLSVWGGGMWLKCCGYRLIFQPCSDIHRINHTLEHSDYWGAWVAQLVRHLTSAQVMILVFVSLSPTLGSLLTWQLRAWSLLWILCLPLSPPLPHSCSVFVSLSLSQK